ncbi:MULTISPECIES: DUF3892 domain-containing protein [unclassified Mesorhizobium]|uniref:DUF3892 domain-containing protein n=1 Tax=unclassified Mesorhizobium TaxID=325217 RepID=UPI003338D176
MTQSAEISCINKNPRLDPYHAITHVGGFQGKQWKLTLDDAIGKIERSEWAFHVGKTILTQVDVVVAVSPYGNKYLKTERDGKEPNNLLSLPECP